MQRPKWALPVSSYRGAQFAITTTQPGSVCSCGSDLKETPSGRGQGNPAWGEKPHLCPHSLPGLGCDTKHRSLIPVQGSLHSEDLSNNSQSESIFLMVFKPAHLFETLAGSACCLSAESQCSHFPRKGTWGGGFRGDGWLTDTPVSEAQPTDTPGCVHAHGIPASLQLCK